LRLDDRGRRRLDQGTSGRLVDDPIAGAPPLSNMRRMQPFQMWEQNQVPDKLAAAN
jgi:hypothetical protein